VARGQIAVELLRLLELAGVDPDEVTADTALDDLYLDSLDYAEIRAAVKERFGVDVDPAELSGTTTVGEATDMIASKVVKSR
jgi:acyl carrier protein